MMSMVVASQSRKVQALSNALDESDSLRFFVEPFARELVKITLYVETKAIEWIANHSKEFKFLIGNSKDYKVPYIIT